MLLKQEKKNVSYIISGSAIIVIFRGLYVLDILNVLFLQYCSCNN